MSRPDDDAIHGDPRRVELVRRIYDLTERGVIRDVIPPRKEDLEALYEARTRRRIAAVVFPSVMLAGLLVQRFVGWLVVPGGEPTATSMAAGERPAVERHRQTSLALHVLFIPVHAALLLLWLHLLRREREVSRELRLERARRALSVRRGIADLLSDPRPPVIYLRPFEKDVRTRWFRASPEERLLSETKRLGPFVALGRQLDEDPVDGASRIYTRHESWREVVDMLIEPAQLIVMRLGTSPGLQWEVERCFRDDTRGRLVLFSSDRTDEAAYRALAPRLRTLTGRPVPRRAGRYLAWEHDGQVRRASRLSRLLPREHSPA
jgi:hypothetical protein